MKILQYLPGLPPVMGGGMIKYAIDLIFGEKQAGHEVIMLVPGYFTHSHKDITKIVRKKWNQQECYKIVNPLPVSGGKGVSDITELIKRGDRQVYTRFLEKIKPDIIHIHSLMGLHIAFMETASQMNIPIIYTTHDYYGICPKVILLRNMEQCTVTDGSQCFDCIDTAMTVKKLRCQQSEIYKFLKSNRFINFLEYSQKLIPIKIYLRSLWQKNRKENNILKDNVQNIQLQKQYKELQCYYKEMFGYVTKFHYNSRQSETVFTQYMGNITGEVVSISNRNITDRRKKRNYEKTLRIGFIGRDAYKGFELLKEVLGNLYAGGMRDFECHVYFNPKEKLPSYIINHAPYKEDEMDQVYDSMDILVLPSIWRETYGLVVLEALSYGVPVIVSHNVGAKEILEQQDGMGIIVEPTNDALQEALEKVYFDRDLLKQMNMEICNCKMGLNYEKHVCKMIDMYSSTGKK